MDTKTFSEKKKRILGALIGVHSGDSLGATLEFTSFNDVQREFPNGHRSIIGGGPFQWKAGHATDDTDLTRAVLLAYTKSGESDVVKAAADNMLKWVRGDWPDRKLGSRPMDIGGATATGLDNYRRTKDPRKCGAGRMRAGNGSLMRCIPSAFLAKDKAHRETESMEISAITHDDIRCTIACAAYNDIAALLIAGQSATDAVRSGLESALRLASSVPGGLRQHADLVAEAIELGLSEDAKPSGLVKTGPEILAGGGRGFVLESLTLAIAAVLDKRSIVDVLSDIVCIGGDTDTNGAIAGGLLGARDGIDAIPEDWIRVLQFGQEFYDIVRELDVD